MDKYDLQRRTKRFALRALKVVEALPSGQPGWTIASQLTRSATSVASHYRAACRGRSRAEFASKIGVVEEEADETALWLEMITEAALLPGKRVRPLWQEAQELISIMSSSQKTARKPLSNNRKSEIGNRQ